MSAPVLDERHPDNWEMPMIFTDYENCFSVAYGPDIEFELPVWAENQVKTLIEAGITHVVDVRIERNDEDQFLDLWESLTDKQAPEYVHLPMDDDGGRVPRHVWKKVVSLRHKIQQEVAETSNEARVYVHCHMGVNRSPSIALALLDSYGSEKFIQPLIHLGMTPFGTGRYLPQFYKYLGIRDGYHEDADSRQHLFELIVARTKSSSHTVGRKRLAESQKQEMLLG